MRNNLIIILIVAGLAISQAQNMRGFQDNKTATLDQFANTTHINMDDFIGNHTRNAFNSTLNQTTFTNNTSFQFNFTETRNFTKNKNHTFEFSSFNYTNSNYSYPTNGSQVYPNPPSQSLNNTNYTTGSWNQQNTSMPFYNSTQQGKFNTSQTSYPYYNGRNNKTNSSYAHGNNSYGNYGVGSGYTNSSHSSNRTEYYRYEYYDFNDQSIGFLIIGGLFKLAITIAFFYVMVKWWKNRQERLNYLRSVQTPLTQQIPQNYYHVQNPSFQQQQQQQPQQHQMWVAYQPNQMICGYNMVPQNQPHFINNPIPQVQQAQPIQINGQPNQVSSFEIQQPQRHAYPALNPQN